MEATNVDVAVAFNAVLKALVNVLALLWGSENSRNRLRNDGFLRNQSTELLFSNALNLGVVDRANHSRHSKLLGRGGGIVGTVSRNDTRSILAIQHTSKEGGARGRLSVGSGRVRSTTIVQAREIAGNGTFDAITVGSSSTRGVGQDVAATIVTRDVALGHEVGVRAKRVGGNVGHRHVESRLNVVAKSRVEGGIGHEATSRHGNMGSSLVHVVGVSQTKVAKRADNSTKTIIVGWGIVNVAGASIVGRVRSKVGSGAHAVTAVVAAVSRHHGWVLLISHVGIGVLQNAQSVSGSKTGGKRALMKASNGHGNVKYDLQGWMG